MLIIEEKHKKQQVVNKVFYFSFGELSVFQWAVFQHKGFKTRDIALNSIIYKQLQFKETYSTTV